MCKSILCRKNLVNVGVRREIKPGQSAIVIVDVESASDLQMICKRAEKTKARVFIIVKTRAISTFLMHPEGLEPPQDAV